MNSAEQPRERLGSRLHKHINRLRSRSRNAADESKPRSLSNEGSEPVPALKQDDAQIEIIDRTVPAIAPGQDSIRPLEPPNNIKDLVVSSDLWSAAFREAVGAFGKDLDVAILKSRNVEQLFKELEDMDKEASQESAFLRGVKYLRSIQVPLERLRLAIDLATPLTALEPTVMMVFGVVRSVTAIAISLASADLEFAKQIGEMLEYISYIDDCDTLGQKANKKDIHRALVSVYTKILEFYKVAYEILTQKGVKLVMKMVLEQGRLPEIVQAFLKQADFLRKLVQKATWEIVQDIKNMLYNKEISRWLGGEKMKRQSQYHSDLRELRNDEACKFLLTSPDFLKWYEDPDERQLVILGDMGSGKTVATAFLIDELIHRNKSQLPQPKVCYYYCRDDETGKDINILSVIILAILEQMEGLKRSFVDWYKESQASGNIEPATDRQKLEEFLERLIEAIDRRLYIVVDGLDECDRRSRNRLLKTLDNLSLSNPRLKTIIASRPEEEILEQLRPTRKIEIPRDATRDGMIVEHTVEKRLFYLSKPVKALIVENLSKSAQGSAIWTRMVIELIEVRGIKGFQPMQKFLRELPLPQQLSKVYDALISRSTSDDSENQELANIALTLLAVARRPLSILELAWAAALGTAQDEITSVSALEETVDHQRVLDLIHPFITQIDYTELSQRQIRLVHQSVKEYLAATGTVYQRRLQDPTIVRTSNQSKPQRLEQAEACVLEICVRYLLLDDINDLSLFSDEQLVMEELPQVDIWDDDQHPVDDYDPNCTWEEWEKDMIFYDPVERGFGAFFVYASSFWLLHFGVLEPQSIPSLTCIEGLCQNGSKRLSNWTQQYCRPDCAVKQRFQFDVRLYDPLGITATYGSEAMLRHMTQHSDFDRDFYLPEPVVQAAEEVRKWGDLRRLRILFLDGTLCHQLRTLNFFRVTIWDWVANSAVASQWFDHIRSPDDWNAVFDLVDHVSDEMVQQHWGNRLLCLAARNGCMPVIKRLMTKAQHDQALRNELFRDVEFEEERCFGIPGHQAIGQAVLGDHIDVVEYLLSQTDIDAHLQHLNRLGQNVLHLAAVHCNAAMFLLLVPLVEDRADLEGHTALTRIIMSDASRAHRLESAKALLVQYGGNRSSDVDIELKAALQTAVQLEELEMCSLITLASKVVSP